MKYTTNMSRTERKFSILATMLQSAFDNEQGRFVEQWFTLRSIARRVGLQPSIYLVTLLDELIKEKAVVMRWGVSTNGHSRREYSVLESALDLALYAARFQDHFANEV